MRQMAFVVSKARPQEQRIIVAFFEKLLERQCLPSAARYPGKRLASIRP